TEEAAEDRVVPGLRELIVQARLDALHVRALDLWPARSVQQKVAGEHLDQPSGDLPDLLLIQADSCRRCGLSFLPQRLLKTALSAIGDAAEVIARLLKAALSAIGDAAEVIAVIVKTFKDQAGDVASRPGRGH
nr:hypothetical protein [Tanacetum cinerariifolium]